MMKMEKRLKRVLAALDEIASDLESRGLTEAAYTLDAGTDAVQDVADSLAPHRTYHGKVRTIFPDDSVSFLEGLYGLEDPRLKNR